MKQSKAKALRQATKRELKHEQQKIDSQKEQFVELKKSISPKTLSEILQPPICSVQPSVQPSSEMF
jgi:predicted Rossmann fold nucleotide-binding protein DprA/Smf involved in DNA uptake